MQLQKGGGDALKHYTVENNLKKQWLNQNQEMADPIITSKFD